MSLVAQSRQRRLLVGIVTEDAVVFLDPSLRRQLLLFFMLLYLRLYRTFSMNVQIRFLGRGLVA